MYVERKLTSRCRCVQDKTDNVAGTNSAFYDEMNDQFQEAGIKYQ